jgi:hypothetical protein
VVRIVIQYLKDKLPNPFDAMVNKILAAGYDGKLDDGDAMNLLSEFLATVWFSKNK